MKMAPPFFHTCMLVALRHRVRFHDKADRAINYGNGASSPDSNRNVPPPIGLLCAAVLVTRMVKPLCPAVPWKDPDAGVLVYIEQFSDFHGSNANTLLMPVSIEPNAEKIAK